MTNHSAVEEDSQSVSAIRHHNFMKVLNKILNSTINRYESLLGVPLSGPGGFKSADDVFLGVGSKLVEKTQPRRKYGAQ